MAKKKSIIPGLTFSWKRAVGITGAKQRFARQTGIPTTRQGLERKAGAALIGALFSIFSSKKR
ncbi:MAG: hypothetical protein LBS50_08160 [Prevotellaceae bacterium]|jgi:hypothetical protein|nr:hypothetical protein [Prevotellaceae bacterium]